MEAITIADIKIIISEWKLVIERTQDPNPSPSKCVTEYLFKRIEALEEKMRDSRDLEYLLREIKNDPEIKTVEDVQALTNWYLPLEECQKVLDLSNK